MDLYIKIIIIISILANEDFMIWLKTPEKTIALTLKLFCQITIFN